MLELIRNIVGEKEIFCSLESADIKYFSQKYTNFDFKKQSSVKVPEIQDGFYGQYLREREKRLLTFYTFIIKNIIKTKR